MMGGRGRPGGRRAAGRGLLAAVVSAGAASAVAAGAFLAPAANANAGAAAGAAAGPRVTAITRGDDGRFRVELEAAEASYYILTFRRELTDVAAEQPVAIAAGTAGRLVLAEPLGIGGAQGFYRVIEQPRDDPGDFDGDGRDDVTEMEDSSGELAPFNPAMTIPFHDGVARIPDRETFEALSYQGLDVLIDRHLEGLQFVKFTIRDFHSDNPSVYFLNTRTHRAHFRFAAAVGLPITSPNERKGEFVFHPNLTAPSGEAGLYRFEFEPNDAYDFGTVQRAHELLAANMPFLRNNLVYYPMPDAALPRYRAEKALFDASRVGVLLVEDLYADVSYLPLNRTVGYGRLRRMNLGERPAPIDLVIYSTIPNEMPPVSGIITTVPQTPLSHVNLRAVQDGVPNAFIRDALEDPAITALIGRDVYFRVGAEGYEIREATVIEQATFFDGRRPAEPQVPARDLSATEIRSLGEVGFGDSGAFGVKAANLAALRTFGLPEGLVPDGAAVPFHFFDVFMEANGFYEEVGDLLADADFQTSADVREAELERLRARIRGGFMPTWMVDALGEIQASFGPFVAIRCRSSTNNEDLPGFSGAGLYDSFTHHPDEGHLSKSVRQVYASLWNFRAFEERDFYRVDHLATAMGVLLHPNFSDERANGVAVTDDPFYLTNGNFYLNAQVGENLVTNPSGAALPEEILLSAGRNSYTVVRRSNRIAPGAAVLAEAHLWQLRAHLNTIHDRFRALYQPAAGDPFSIEVEFKITAEGELSIKQARPWVY